MQNKKLKIIMFKDCYILYTLIVLTNIDIL